MKEMRSRSDRKAPAAISTELFAIGTMPAPHAEVAAARMGGADIPGMFSVTLPAVRGAVERLQPPSAIHRARAAATYGGH
jgi:hypothetical protein